jgi:hypothetical protein
MIDLNLPLFSVSIISSTPQLQTLRFFPSPARLKEALKDTLHALITHQRRVKNLGF